MCTCTISRCVSRTFACACTCTICAFLNVHKRHVCVCACANTTCVRMYKCARVKIFGRVCHMCVCTCAPASSCRSLSLPQRHTPFRQVPPAISFCTDILEAFFSLRPEVLRRSAWVVVEAASFESRAVCAWSDGYDKACKDSVRHLQCQFCYALPFALEVTSTTRTDRNLCVSF